MDTTGDDTNQRQRLAVQAAVAVSIRHGTMVSLTALCNLLLQSPHNDPVDAPSGSRVSGVETSGTSGPLYELVTHRCFASLPRATAGQDNNTERLRRIRRGSSLTGWRRSLQWRGTSIMGD